MSSLLGCALLCVEFQLKEEQANINCLRLLYKINFKENKQRIPFI